MINSVILFPLQVSASDFVIDSSISPVQVIIFFAVFAVIVGIMVILNAAKKGSTGGKTAGAKSTGTTGSSGGIFSIFVMHRLAKNIGLNHDQKKMLDFVFKTDAVTDPEKSIGTPALLDRHFRRAFRVLLQASHSEPETQRKLGILFSTRNMLESSAIGTISSTRQLKDDTILTLNHGKDKIEVSVVSTKGEHLAVEPPKTVLGSHIKIPRGTRLTVVFFTKNNKAFSFETRVIGYSNTHGVPSLLLANSNSLRFLSQRRFRRRHAVIACFMYLVYVEGSGKKQRLVVDKRRMQGNIMDISVGGCSIKTNASIQVGAKFKIEFTQSEKNVSALGQVLRINRTGANTIIHVKFLRVTLKSMNLINAFVYEYANE
jgi:c-di-GMP-binding flagellar brake protein YcgR